MTPLHVKKARRSARVACILAGTALTLLVGSTARLQAQGPDHPQPPEPGQVQTFFLKNISDFHQLNDIQTALRNMLNRARIYAISTENAITVRGTEDELATAQKMIAELDRPMQVYRVTYSITDLDNGKRTGAHSITVLVPANGKGTLKLGSRVPIVTGRSDAGSNAATEIQYQDVGLNLDATASGAALHTKLEQTAVSTEKSNVGIQDPVISQTFLEGESPLGSPKPVVLGTIDVPNSTHQQQITVSAELLSGNPE
ncbi:MAG: secretin N-terminal domain-containing protein [Terracidiphilus sp.]